MEEVEDIVIVGAGIAGLTTSLALHRLGFRSIVLESWDCLRVEGFAITTWTNAWKALDALGVGDSLRQEHQLLIGNITTSAVSGLQTSGFLFKTEGKDGECEARCVKRKLLLEALANALPSGTVRYSSKVVSIQESSINKLVHLADNTVFKTKVLIGCDGVNSVVAQWLGFNSPAWSGRYAVRGYLDCECSHGSESNFTWFFGKGVRSGVCPCNDNTLYWFITWTPLNHETELEENPDKLKKYLLSRLGKIPLEIKAKMEGTKPEHFLPMPLRHRYPWQLLWGNISRGNVCIAGDALHPMTPDLGQGGCSSLEDGIVLARCLAEAMDVKKRSEGEDEGKEEYERIEMGLKKYAKERRWRIMVLVFSSYMTGFIQESEGKFMNFVRDKILAGFLARLLLKISDFDCGKLS